MNVQRGADAELRRLAEAALPTIGDGAIWLGTDAGGALARACNPATMLALLDRIEAARALHQPAKKGGTRCRRCGEIVPCSTIRALDGTP